MNDWTEFELHLLAAYWPVHTTREIWQRLLRRHSEDSIRNKAGDLHLTRPTGEPSLRAEVEAALAERSIAPLYRGGA